MCKDWNEAIIVPLYKGKKAREMCGNQRDIALLSACVKVHLNIFLARMKRCFVNDVVSESQYGSQSDRVTMDMISTSIQMQQNRYEQDMDIVELLIDLSKAIDTVNRSLLCKILGKL